MTSSCETIYNEAFYRAQMADSRRSANVVVAELLRWLQPASVVDVGCGTGAWLAAFEAAGVTDTLGLDGDYVDRRLLQIDPKRFVPTDLRTDAIRAVGRRFDLAMSVEVAEHLPPERAAGFVADLTTLSDHVLFSAAAPHQGGTEHLNENWPEYWALLFRQQGYDPWDLLRPSLWNDDRVEWWYRQNVLLFVRRGAGPETLPTKPPIAPVLGIVHPESLLWTALRAGARPDDVYTLERGYLRSVVQNYRTEACLDVPSGAPDYRNRFNVQHSPASAPKRDEWETTCLHFVAEARGLGITEGLMYGAGEVGQAFVRAAQLLGLRLHAVIDRNHTLWGTRFHDLPVVSLAAAADGAAVLPIFIASFSSVDAINSAVTQAFGERGARPAVYSWVGRISSL